MGEVHRCRRFWDVLHPVFYDADVRICIVYPVGN